MNSRPHHDGKVVSTLRWLARIASLFSLSVLLLFLMSDGLHSVRRHEWVGLVFFPFGVMLGLVVSWRFEMLGSLLSVASLVLFYVIYGLIVLGRMPVGWWFIAFTSPALVFLATAVLQKRARHAHLS